MPLVPRRPSWRAATRPWVIARPVFPYELLLQLPRESLVFGGGELGGRLLGERQLLLQLSREGCIGGDLLLR